MFTGAFIPDLTGLATFSWPLARPICPDLFKQAVNPHSTSRNWVGNSTQSPRGISRRIFPCCSKRPVFKGHAPCSDSFVEIAGRGDLSGAALSPLCLSYDCGYNESRHLPEIFLLFTEHKVECPQPERARSHPRVSLCTADRAPAHDARRE